MGLNYHRSLCKLRYHISELRSIINIHNENFNITYLNCAKLSSFTMKTSSIKYVNCAQLSSFTMQTSISYIWTALNYHYSQRNFNITYLNCAQLSPFTTKTSISHIWTALNYHRSPRKLQYQICELRSIIIVHYANFDITYLKLRSIITIHNENFNITYLNCAQLSPFTTKTSISHIWTALNYHRSPRKLQYQICEMGSIIVVHYENFDITYLNCVKLSSFTTKTSISDMWNGLNYRRSLWKLRYHISELR